MLAPFVASVLAGVLFVVALRRGLALLARAIPSRVGPAPAPDDVRVQVLVLGDIGRSPRMQYHAISLAKHRRRVDIVAYKSASPRATCSSPRLPFPSPLLSSPLFPPRAPTACAS